MSNKNYICLTREIVTRILEALERADDELDSFGLGRTHNGRKGLIETIRILHTSLAQNREKNNETPNPHG